ncbi:MAG: hypothetical protein ACFB22_07770 [Rhodothalassiaceae bacterium]
MTQRWNHLIAAAVLSSLTVAQLASAQEPSSNPTRQERYLACTGQVAEDADAALAEAAAWLDASDDRAARHCLALAQVETGAYAEAAENFQAVARAVQEQRGLISTLEADGLDLALLSASLFAQAGHAALLAGAAPAAEAHLTEALDRVPQEEADVRLELLIDRARARGGQQQYEAALEDLNQAHLIDPQRLDVLLYRATTRRHLDRLDVALADIEAALSGRPGWADALLERGNLRALTGDEAGAQSDWLQVIRYDPDSLAAAAAQQNLEQLQETILSPQ